MDICEETGVWLRNSLKGHIFDANLASALVNILNKKNVKSVYDLGCGHGEYTRYLNQNSFECSGFDGNPYTNQITNGLCYVLNLTEDINLPEVDCVLCLEVGEHIPKKFESVLINNIVKSTSNYLILSWAVEGQGGEGHVNCRNNDYVKGLLEDRGFRNISEDELILREASHLSWFKNTIMVFEKR